MLLLVGLVWGLGFVAQETAMEHIGPFQFVTLRFAIAGLVVLPFAFFEFRKVRATDKQAPFVNRAHLPLVVTVGCMFFLGMSLQQVALLGTTVTNSGMLTGLYVVLVPLIAFVFFRQKQPPVIWGAAAIAFIGIWLLGGGSLDNFTWGDGMTIVCAVFNALHVIIIGKAVMETNRPVTIAALQFIISAFIGLGCFIVAKWVGWTLEPDFSLVPFFSALPEILYAAIIAGALAFTLQAIGQRYTKPADAAIMLSSEALFAALAAAIILTERLEVIGYIGCAFLLSAIVIVSVVSAKLDEQTTKFD